MKYLALVLLTGCLPYALPPVTADVGALRTTERGSRTGVRVNAGISPLHFAKSIARTRRFDATIGGSFERHTHDSWGASIAAGPVLYPWFDNPARISRDRVLPQVVGRWTSDGTAVGARLVVERAMFADGGGTGTVNAVAGYGEGAAGFYVETELRFRDNREWAVTVGVTLRLPAVAGVACCLMP